MKPQPQLFLTDLFGSSSRKQLPDTQPSVQDHLFEHIPESATVASAKQLRLSVPDGHENRSPALFESRPEMVEKLGRHEWEICGQNPDAIPAMLQRLPDSVECGRCFVRLLIDRFDCIPGRFTWASHGDHAIENGPGGAGDTIDEASSLELDVRL